MTDQQSPQSPTTQLEKKQEYRQIVKVFSVLIAIYFACYVNKNFTHNIVPNLLSDDHYCNFQSFHTNQYLHTDGIVVNSIDASSSIGSRFLIRIHEINFGVFNEYTIQSVNGGYLEHDINQNSLILEKSILFSPNSVFHLHRTSEKDRNGNPVDLFEIRTNDSSFLKFNTNNTISVISKYNPNDYRTVLVSINCYKL